MTKYKDYITAESIFNKAIAAIKKLDNKKDDEQQIQITSLYNIACIYSLTNDIDSSIKYLDSAIAIGYSDISSLNTDNNLMNVRKSDKFNELMIKYKIF